MYYCGNVFTEKKSPYKEFPQHPASYKELIKEQQPGTSFPDGCYTLFLSAWLSVKVFFISMTVCYYSITDIKKPGTGGFCSGMSSMLP